MRMAATVMAIEVMIQRIKNLNFYFFIFLLKMCAFKQFRTVRKNLYLLYIALPEGSDDRKNTTGNSQDAIYPGQCHGSDER